MLPIAALITFAAIQDLFRSFMQNRQSAHRPGLLLKSLSAVSEAPMSGKVSAEVRCEGRFRYSDLKEASWGAMGFEWDLVG
jgi:hypothetical protein